MEEYIFNDNLIFFSEDHTRGLSTFTIMAGMGGGFGYAMGAINWDVTFIGYIFLFCIALLKKINEKLRIILILVL